MQNKVLFLTFIFLNEQLNQRINQLNKIMNYNSLISNCL